MSEQTLRGVAPGVKNEMNQQIRGTKFEVQNLYEQLQAHSKSFDGIAGALNDLLLEVKTMNEDFSTIQSSVGRWGKDEMQYMEEDPHFVGNAKPTTTPSDVPYLCDM